MKVIVMTCDRCGCEQEVNRVGVFGDVFCPDEIGRDFCDACLEGYDRWETNAKLAEEESFLCWLGGIYWKTGSSERMDIMSIREGLYIHLCKRDIGMDFMLSEEQQRWLVEHTLSYLTSQGVLRKI